MIQKVFNRRIYVTAAIIFFIAVLYVFKLFSLHFSNKIILNDPYTSNEIVRRGYITDRKGNILSLSIEKKSLFANPEQIENPSETALLLAPILNMDQREIERRLRLKRLFIWIKRMLDDSTMSRINSLNIKGLYGRKEFKRVYPNGQLASNLIGFAGIDNRGLEGLEYKYNDALNGDYDSKYSIEVQNLKYGNNIILTIDRYIQHYSEKYLKETVEKYAAARGAVIITEPKTGKILAYAKYPSYDPNEYWKYKRKDWRSFTITDSFEPGSTMKIFTAASILKENQYNQNKYFNCTGAVQIGDTVINCTGVHGKINLNEAIKHSCNVGVILSVKNVSNARHYATLRQFGFGEETGCGIPGESSGILRDVEKWSGLSKYSIAIGQEISVTSIQLAAAYGAVANGGIYIVPSVIERIDSYTGEPLFKHYIKSRGRILTKDQSDKLKGMLRLVVEGGTGRAAKSDYYKFAGKTGTAQKYIKSEGFYSRDHNIASFAGFAPYDDPKLVAIIIIDEPKNATGGGTVAAPLFKKITEKSLLYMGETERVLKNFKPINKKVKQKLNYKKIPDLKNMNVVDALYVLSLIQNDWYIKYGVEGYGRIYKQMPPAGSDLKNGMKIVLYAEDSDE